jgi:ribosome-associated protein
MNEPDEDALDADDLPLPPSKSSRKREAHSLQKLGEQLIAMREADFLTLPLPETLVDAIREARRLTSRPALARQRQYIGKLMREVDIEPLETALAALTDRQNARARLRK